MANEAELKFDVRGFAKALQKAPQLLFEEMDDALKKQGLEFDRKFQRNMTGRPGVMTRSGMLRRSFTQGTVGRNLDDLHWLYGSNSPYARIQEKGGVVKPRKAKWLTIPTQNAATASGVAKESARSMFQRFGNRMVFIGPKSKGLSPGIYLKDGKSMQKMFHIAKSVKIKGRLGLFRTFKRHRPFIIRKVNEGIGTALMRMIQK